MATTIVAYTKIQGARTRHIRGTVGTTEAPVLIVAEPVVRVTIENNDTTLANTVAIAVGRLTPGTVATSDQVAAVATGYLIYGGAPQVIYLREGDFLTAIAAADRDVSFLVQVEGSCN